MTAELEELGKTDAHLLGPMLGLREVILKQLLSLSIRAWHILDHFFPGTLMEKYVQINVFSFRENDTAVQ